MNSPTRKHVFSQQINQEVSCDNEQAELAASTSSSNDNEEKENKKSVTLIKPSGRRTLDTLETGRLAMHCSVAELNASDEDELTRSCSREEQQQRQQFGGCQNFSHRQQQQKHRPSAAAVGYESGGNRATSRSRPKQHQATWVGLQQPTSGNSSPRQSSPAAQMSSRQQQQQPSRHAHGGHRSQAVACQQNGADQPPRSTVIDYLDRLLVRINSSRRSVSPSESSSSTFRAISPPNRSARQQQQQEFDYSTLCRDEFSNFIPFAPSNNNDQHTNSSSDPKLLKIDQSSNGFLDQSSNGFLDQSSNGFRHNNYHHNHHPQQQQPHKQPRTTPKQASSKTSKTSRVASGGPMLVGVHSDEASSANHRSSIKPIDQHGNHLLTNHHQHQYQAQANHEDDSTSQSIGDNCCHSNGGSLDSPEFPNEQLSSEGEIKSSSGCSTSHNGHSLELHRYDDDEDLRTPPPSGSCSPASKTACSSSDQSLVSSLGSASSAVSVSSPPLSHEYGELFDIYVHRVRSLLRLTKGDKSVSMEEAFGWGGRIGGRNRQLDEICVSAEHKTDIEFAPLERPNSARVVQELEISDLTSDEDNRGEPGTPGQKLTTATRIVEGEFASIISEPNTLPRLNWSAKSSTENVCADVDDDAKSEEERLKELQRSLVNRLFLESKELLASQSSECDDRLVSTIVSHTREFYQNYTIYQRELKARTSFANDWHKNWLFAFKRPNEESSRELDRPASRQASDQQLEENHLQASGFKRAKMSPMTANDNEEKVIEPTSVGLGFPTTTDIDLIEYSTLLLNKHKPIKLNYRVKQTTGNSLGDYEKDLQADRDEDSGGFSAIESCYAAQEEPKSEMFSNSLRSIRQLDACGQLLQDDDYEHEGENCENTDPNKQSKKLKLSSKEQAIRKRGFLVSYKSSVACGTSNSCCCCRGNRLFFSAYGYQFEIPLKRVSLLANPESPKLELLKHKVLTKFKEIFDPQTWPQSPQSLATNRNGGMAGEQVKFLVNLTNVELASELPVIQFCAKVCGSLPIRVRWFNESNGSELSDTIYSSPRSTHRKSLNVKNCAYWAPSGGRAPAWPLDLHADYDYEHQTKWLSWHRFRRCRGEIMFEIRNANPELDYNQTYRCVIQNYCSERGCSFKLTRRRVDDLLIDKRRPSEPNFSCDAAFESKGPGKAAAALLRCWSQRTLNKPQPNTLRENYDDLSSSTSATSALSCSAKCAPANNASDSSAVSDLQQSTSATLSRRQQTVGWRSASFAAQAKADVKRKFGEDFPYHPENLLKRLEENKFPVRINCKGLPGRNNKSELPCCPEKHSATRATSSPATNLTTHGMQFAHSSFDSTAVVAQTEQQEPRSEPAPEFYPGFDSEAPSGDLASNFARQQLQIPVQDTPTTTSRAHEHFDGQETVGQPAQQLRQRLVTGGQIQQAGGRRTCQVDGGQIAVDDKDCDDCDDGSGNDYDDAATAWAPKPRPRSKSSSVIRATVSSVQTNQQNRTLEEEQGASWLRSSEQVARFGSKLPPSSGHSNSDERQQQQRQRQQLEEFATPKTKPTAVKTVKATTGIQAMSSKNNGQLDGQRRMGHTPAPSGEPHSQSRPKLNNVKSLISRFSVKG